MTITEPETFVPTGRPVRRALLTVVVAGVVLAGVWWTGLGAPRASAEVPVISPDRAVLAIRNDAPTPVRLRRLLLEDERLGYPSIELDVRLAGGEQVEVELPFRAPSCREGPDVDDLYARATATVETVLRLTRTVDVGDLGDIGDQLCRR